MERSGGKAAPLRQDLIASKTRLEKFIDEKTGRMRQPRTPALLEDVYCNSRMFCPRSMHSWWREMWLEKVAKALLNRT